MTAAKAKMQGKIQATRQWLNRAEDHFEKEQATRGQLDLLLAEAEIRSTREHLAMAPGGFRLTGLRQGLAVSLAAVIAAVGWVGFWWGTHSGQQVKAVDIHKPIPWETISDNSQRNLPAQPSQVSASMTVAEAPQQPQSVTVHSGKPAQEVKTEPHSATRKEATESISDQEMKFLIQAAGQSLRGRTKQ